MSAECSMNLQPTRQRAVYIVGASSVGKTTLCNAIAESLQVDPAVWVKEVAREVMRTTTFSRETIDQVEMQHAIMTAQLAAEARARAAPPHHGPVLLLSDRSAVDPIVYAATSGADGAAKRQRLLHDPAFEATLAFYRDALFFLLQPVPAWLEDDGIRSLEDPWNYNAHLRATLTELGIPLIEIGEDVKDLDQRVDIVRKHLR
ncbi:AAA domain-containing protein [Phanerochaete sordida]|uniref:AAA domain-containing protein n=1 Tax=Phanerochaete sordida TaxID=48140 RepID=A0A9P3GM36_9APHY|nr:AAA domain-containing protein [Phanerochaete sordida]